MNRFTGILFALAVPFLGLAQGGDLQLRAKADGLFAEGRFAEAYPLYSQLVSLNPADRDLNYRFGACTLYGGDDKEKAIGHLKYACEVPATPALSWYFLGRAYHLAYRFKEALQAYEHYRGTADKKVLAQYPVDALEQQCRNGQHLLSNLKDVAVHNKVEVASAEFFRFYDLSSIGGKIVVTPDELRSSLDKKSKDRGLIYLPDKGGPIYFSSLGKDGRTGRDIYRTEVLPSGQFAEPVKLAGYVNTDQDEDYPFLAPDGKSFYFSSKGHNSMGGYDVFRTSYDRGLDVFGSPENMDFAVNTPDDDFLYLVDPEGKEACFASGRSSHQGMVHVYRVSTTQVPINITVLKGTFASEVDKEDRKAHIVVEDAMTRERVSDVRTDINGSYVLALPRSGRYKFVVEAGPSGRTHVGYVEVPRNDSPQAYRQEMSLVQQAGQEKLMIRNYFEEPLGEDLIALALDEIKRRARLEVTSAPEVVATPAPEAATADVMTAAGFTGDVTKEAAVKLAEADARELEQKTRDLQEMEDAAYSIALDNAAESERLAQRSKELVAQAEAIMEESRKAELMTEAARTRQRSREANLRARSAFTAGQDLDTERMATQRNATNAAKLAGDLGTAVRSGNDAQAAAPLKELKARLDVKNGPEGTVDVAERTRRAATELDQEAAKTVQMARSKSEDESELVDRINRLKREQEATGSRSKKEEMGREIAQYEQQLGFLREEVVTARAKAKVAEERTAVARGEASLTRFLTALEQREGLPTTTLDAERRTALGQMIAGNESRIQAIAIDERFDALIAGEVEAAAPNTFNWQLQTSGDAVADGASTTRTAERDTTGGTERMAGNTVTMQAGDAGNGSLKQGEVAQVPVSSEGGVSPAAAVAVAAVGASSSQDQRSQVPAEGADRSSAQQPSIQPTTVVQEPSLGDTASHTAQVPARAEEELVSMRGVGVVNGQDAGNVILPAVPDTGDGVGGTEQAFLEANDLAELKQLRAAERNKTRRDSLDGRIAALEQRMREEQAASQQEAQAVTMPEETPEGEAKAFVPTITSEALTATIFPDYQGDRDRIASGTLDPQEKALSLHGLELMLVDSIETETARQLAMLEADPAVAPEVLPRVDRLRQLKEEHLEQADRILEDSQQQYAAHETIALEQAVQQEAERQRIANGDQASARPVLSTTSHVDRYVSVQSDNEYVYESVVEHRSPTVKEAVREKDRDLEQLADLGDRVDSMETLLGSMPQGKEYDKLRTKADRLIDQEMILRTDMGQRMAFISREEYKAGQDSLQRVAEAVTRKGLAPSEPLVQMSRELEAGAKAHMTKAEQFRKTADRSEDIVKRDELYRQAYQEELQALREQDKAITVNNFMLSEDHQRDMRLSYMEVEQRLFGEEAIAAAPAVNNGPLVAESNVRTLPPDSVVIPQRAGGQPSDSTASLAQQAAAHTKADMERYGNFMTTDASQMGIGEALALDVSTLALESEQAREEAARLEQRSLLLADEAMITRDSMATAKKRDRERLQVEAVRLQQLSDSLHQASLAMERRSQELELRKREAGDAQAFALRLSKYYYLGNEDQVMVMSEEDHSRYFMARTKALEQEQAAASARLEAAGSHQLADTLLAQATRLLGSPDLPDGRLSEQRMAQAKVLSDRSVALHDHADSLSASAARLTAAADLNERQAVLLLQGMPAERSTAIMALEQRTRRTDALLAESRALIAQVDAIREKEQAASQGVRAPAPTVAPVARPVTERSEVAATRTEPVAPTPPAANVPDGGFAIPATLTEDLFSFRASGSAAQPILKDQPMPAGVVYKVQIGAFKNEIPKELFNDMSPVMGETTATGVTRYTAGLFTSAEAAEKARELVRERGYRDAFVVAYDDGRRVSMAAARQASGPVPAGASVAAAAPEVQRPAATIQAPVASAIQPLDDAQVLANYPPSAEELLKQFAPPADAAAYYDAPGAAPARQVETVKGLFFTVQVGVYSKPTALDKLFNITPLNSERTETNKIRYTTGVYLDLDKARVRKDEAVTLGVKDAFITAYLNGKRIPMRDARALLQKFGPSVLADPTIATH